MRKKAKALLQKNLSSERPISSSYSLPPQNSYPSHQSSSATVCPERSPTSPNLLMTPLRSSSSSQPTTPLSTPSTLAVLILPSTTFHYITPTSQKTSNQVLSTYHTPLRSSSVCPKPTTHKTKTNLPHLSL